MGTIISRNSNNRKQKTHRNVGLFFTKYEKIFTTKGTKAFQKTQSKTFVPPFFFVTFVVQKHLLVSSFMSFVVQKTHPLSFIKISFSIFSRLFSSRSCSASKSFSEPTPLATPKSLGNMSAIS